MDNIKGSILGRSTLKKIINSKSLIIESEKGVHHTFTTLVEEQRVDETSITLNINKLYRFSANISELNIIERYDFDNNYELIEINGDSFLIEPNEYFIGITHEYLTIPDTITGFIGERRTSTGNLGIEIKGFVPPGLLSEQVRFTIQNFGKVPVRLYVGRFPPMKVIFHTLTSKESYRADRNSRVKSDDTISSGLGSQSDANVVKLTSLSIDSKIKIGKECKISFSIENGIKPLEKITLFPNLCKSSFSITDCSNNWKLNFNDDKKGLFKKRTSTSIDYGIELQKTEHICGTLKMIFKESVEPQLLSFTVECLTNESEKVPVKYPSFPNLTVANNSKIISRIFKNPIVSIILTALLVMFLQKYGETIKTFISELLGVAIDLKH